MKIPLISIGVAAALCCASPALADTSNPPPATPQAAARSAFAKAQVEAAAGHNDAALVDLQVAVKLDPANIAIQKLLGDVEYRLQNYRAAEAAYKAVLASDPKNKDIHNRLGGVYSAEDRLDDAVAEFKASLPSAEGFTNLLDAYAAQGRLGDLEAEYELELSRSPFDASVHYMDGSVLSLEHRYQDAVGQFTQAIGLQPRFADAHNALGKSLGDLGRYDDAINEYKLALSYDPKHYMAMMNWGVELYLQGRYPQALERLKVAQTMNPGFGKTYVNLGVVNDALNQFTQAVELYAKAIDIDPRIPEAYHDLGALYITHGLTNLAEAAFIKGISVVPRNAQLHFDLGYVYLQQQKYDSAAAQLRIAAAEKPNDPDIKKMLAGAESHIQGQPH